MRQKSLKNGEPITFSSGMSTQPTVSLIFEPRGLYALAEVCRGVSIPVMAIGGIEPGNIHAIRSAGAQGVAVISNVWASDSPDRAAASLRQAIVATESLIR